MASLRDRLGGIGELSAPGEAVKIPSDFHSIPSGSLRQIMDAMRSPRLETWFKVDETEFSNEDWTEECQGLTWIGQSWYLSSNDLVRDRWG
jgi:hypothetical protein